MMYYCRFGSAYALEVISRSKMAASVSIELLSAAYLGRDLGQHRRYLWKTYSSMLLTLMKWDGGWGEELEEINSCSWEPFSVSKRDIESKKLEDYIGNHTVKRVVYFLNHINQQVGRWVLINHHEWREWNHWNGHLNHTLGLTLSAVSLVVIIITWTMPVREMGGTVWVGSLATASMWEARPSDMLVAWVSAFTWPCCGWRSCCGGWGSWNSCCTVGKVALVMSS